MFRSRVSPVLLATLCATGLLASGCDPKLVLVDDGGSSNNNNETFEVQPEARAVTAILALHMELMRASLTESAQYDGSSPVAPVTRGLSSPDCVSIAQYSTSPMAYEIRFEGCTDHNGTDLRGGGQTYPLEGVDGFYFLPYGNVEDMLIATNQNDQAFNHVYQSGTLEFAFQRNSGGVDGVVITKFIRHLRGNETIQFSYPALAWGGTHGDWNDYPDNGAKANGVWDSVSGPFEIEFTGQSAVFFTLAGIPYAADLATGAVEVNQ
jgi:hypothetical protein